MNITVRMLLVPALGALLLSGCETRANAEETSAPPVEVQDQTLLWDDADHPWFDAAAAWLCQVPRSSACSDAQLLAIAIALNEGEVVLSEVVLDRLEDPDVRALAEEIIADHQLALNEIRALASSAGIVPVDNDNCLHLKAMSELAIRLMNSKGGEALTASYLAHQVSDHTRALAMIDHLLLPSASTAELRTLLRRQRAVIARHLLHVLELQGETRGMCGAEAAAPVP